MITFIVPAFNEEDHVSSTVATILSAAADSFCDAFEIMLIDDGSTDRTGLEMAALAAQDSRIRQLSNARNLGLGASIRTGIAAACGQSFMVVPGDNDLPKEMMILMLKFRDEADAILTAPLNKEQRNLFRNVISMFYQMAYVILFRTYVNYINGPGIWPTAAARKAKLKSKRFSIISELNVKVLRMGCTFAEVPGYFQAGPKVRRTVTLRNLVEVVVSFLRLAFEVHVSRREQFRSRPIRKQIDFVRRLAYRSTDSLAELKARSEAPNTSLMPNPPSTTIT